jgi:ABC-type branched-subunit amino acid transport system permease subunit
LNGLLYALVGSPVHVILGPLIGATGFRYLTDSLGRLTSQSSLYIGLTLLVVVYIMPNGILGLLDLAVRYIPSRGQERSKQPILHTREGLR